MACLIPKAQRIFDSCKTPEHYEAALRYVRFLLSIYNPAEQKIVKLVLSHSIRAAYHRTAAWKVLKRFPVLY